MINSRSTHKFKQYLYNIQSAIDVNPSAIVSGSIIRITGMNLEASSLSVPIGTLCKVIVSPEHTIDAEVVGFSDKSTYLMSTEDIHGIRLGTPVIAHTSAGQANVGMALLGRILNACGDPIDGLGPVLTEEKYPLIAKPLNPLERMRITTPLDVGIRTINSLLTVGKGQRIGIFAGSGVGKSVLLGMMTKFTKADIVVVGLIGERGREVKEFIDEILGREGLSKAVVVASPSDTSPIMRVNGANLATAIAEYYRDKGFDVLLIVDSLTRFAHAQREISLSIGEMPATKGFTPSVFAKLSQLVERSGNGKQGKGSITAFYTVLIENDDLNDPIGDHVRSVLDGHFVLSRELAEMGHYPAIDIEKSISRVMHSITSAEHQQEILRFRKIFSAYTQHKDIINIGMYQRGTDKSIDEAIRLRDNMMHFMKQGINESASFQDSLSKLTDTLKA